MKNCGNPKCKNCNPNGRQRILIVDDPYKGEGQGLGREPTLEEIEEATSVLHVLNPARKTSRLLISSTRMQRIVDSSPKIVSDRRPRYSACELCGKQTRTGLEGTFCGTCREQQADEYMRIMHENFHAAR